MIRIVIMLCLFVGLTGCTTTFYGSAHIRPKDCVAKCEEWGMQVAGMVAMGEYSDACVCKTKKEGVVLNESEILSIGSVAASAAGVVMQEEERQRRASQR